jgi:hypothetical protein
MKNILSILFCLLCIPAFAQLNIPDRVDPYDPIVAGCQCILPENGEAQFRWKLDEHCKGITSADGKQMYIWSPPGTHEISCFVTTELYQYIDVWVPDPNAPDDVTKAKRQKIKILLSFDTQEYSKTFTVGPAPPPTPPTPPTPPVPPSPDGDFAQAALSWMKAIPSSSFNKDKMGKVADSYTAVAAQAAATTGWTLQAFNSATKDKVAQVLTSTDIAAWRDPFFLPLADKQASIFNDRKLSTTDVPGIVKLWNETATAIKSALASMP